MFGIALKDPQSAGAGMVPKACEPPACAVHRPTYTRRVDEHSGRRLARSTAIFSLATGLSRILGLVREVVASYYFGAAGKINAFTVAFQVPNLVRALVADAALQSAFVPVFTELLEKGERRRAWRVASSLFWLVLLVLSALTALFIVVAPWIIGLFGDPGGDRQLAIGLSRVLFPIVMLLGVSGIVVGILNSYERFSVPALSPVFWNVAIIVGLVIGVPRADTIDGKLYVYAVSIVIGTVIQVLLPMPWLRGHDGAVSVARAARRPWRPGRVSQHACARASTDRIPADPCKRHERAARGTDHTIGVPAWRLCVLADARRRRSSCRVLGRSLLQR